MVTDAKQGGRFCAVKECPSCGQRIIEARPREATQPTGGQPAAEMVVEAHEAAYGFQRAAEVVMADMEAQTGQQFSDAAEVVEERDRYAAQVTTYSMRLRAIRERLDHLETDAHQLAGRLDRLIGNIRELYRILNQ